MLKYFIFIELERVLIFAYIVVFHEILVPLFELFANCLQGISCKQHGLSADNFSVPTNILQTFFANNLPCAYCFSRPN